MELLRQRQKVDRELTTYADPRGPIGNSFVNTTAARIAAVNEVFAADTAQSNMDVLVASSTTIKWQSVTLPNAVLGYDSSNGHFTPTLAGYYRIDVYFNDTHANGSARQGLEIVHTNTSKGASVAEVDTYAGTTADRLYGHKILYCNGVDETFYVQIKNIDGGGTLRYHDMTSGLHYSHITVQYAGSATAAD